MTFFLLLTDTSWLCRVFCLTGSFHIPYLLRASRRALYQVYSQRKEWTL